MKALICPVMLHDKTVFYTMPAVTKRDKSLSVLIAVLIHLAVFALAGACFASVPQAGVQQGLGGIEVSLVAAPTEALPHIAPVPSVPVKNEFAEKQAIKPVVQKVQAPTPSKTMGKDKVTVKSTGGAISQARPDYLKNPAPEYPELARRRGYQGTVLLRAVIDPDGIVVKVEIEQGSGHSILDEAALKAVKGWKFKPGRIGNIPVESTVRVPVKFSLTEA